MLTRSIALRRFSRLVIAAWLGVSPLASVGAKEPYRVTPQEQKQILLFGPHPKYPVGARSAGMQGSGLFRLHVRDETGEVVKVEVRRSTGHTALDDAAVSTFKKWRFRPGSGVTAANIPVTFTP